MQNIRKLVWLNVFLEKPLVVSVYLSKSLPLLSQPLAIPHLALSLLVLILFLLLWCCIMSVLSIILNEPRSRYGHNKTFYIDCRQLANLTVDNNFKSIGDSETIVSTSESVVKGVLPKTSWHFLSTSLLLIKNASKASLLHILRKYKIN